jgi:HEAT repeat protein
MLFSIDRTKSARLLLPAIFSLLILIFVSCSSSTKITYKIENEIAKYDFGQDRTLLMEFADQVNSSVYSETKRNELEGKLINLLSGDATFASKQFACRQLRVIGSEKSLPILSDLLSDAKTTDIARYALEKIHGNAVDEALVKLLGSSSNNIQLGIINTLGVRESENAVSILSDLLKNHDSEISIAAAFALGKIANRESAQRLDEYSTKAKGQLKIVIWDSYLSCADELVIQNKYEDANGIYSNIYRKDIPNYLKRAALVGIINTSKNQAKEILERISNESDEMKLVAISKIRDLRKANEITEFAELLSSLSPANQIQMLSVFEDIADKKSKPYVLETLNSENEAVRIASIKALANIGNENDVLTIVEIAAHKSGDEADYARSTLDLLKGEKIDPTIIKNLAIASDDVKVELIRIVGTRNIKSAFNGIIDLTKSKNSKIRAEAYRSLSEISTDDNLADLTIILLNPPFKADRKKAERTISKVISKDPNSKNNGIILNSLETTSDIENKCSLLKLLGYTNNNDAFKMLNNELQSDNEKIKLASVIGLSSWSTPEPLTKLVQVAETTNDEKIRSTALKGFTNFINLDKNLSDEQRINLYKKSLELAKSGNERNIALDGIGHIDNFESLEIFRSYTNQVDVKETVDDGINRVSWHLFKKNPEKVKKYVLSFLDEVKDEEFQTKNKELLKAIDRFVKKRDSNKSRS